MARRPSRRLAALLIASIAAACSPAVSGVTATTPVSPATTATTAGTTTTPSTTTSPTTSPVPDPGPSPVDDGWDAEVTVPNGDGSFPAVVLVHGGGWVTGGPQIMEPLAEYLNDNGYMTVNTRYTLATFDHAAFPEAVEDVACAVRHAASHPRSDGTVTLVGHSAGAHLGALVALTGDLYRGECSLDGTGVPDRFVGLAGPYDVSRVGLAIAAFFGGGPSQLPDVWDAGNPQLLTDENPDLESLIMYGERDGIVPERFALEFHEALLESGSASLLELIEGARHNQLHDPDLVGDLIVIWLDR